MSGPYGPASGGVPAGPPGGQGPYPPAGFPPYQQQPGGPPGPPPHPAGPPPYQGGHAPAPGPYQQPGQGFPPPPPWGEPAGARPWQPGPQQPSAPSQQPAGIQQQWAGSRDPQRSRGRRQPVDLSKIAPLVVFLLGVLNFIWGFLPTFSIEGGVPDAVPRSIYAVGPGYLPILLLTGGLLALGAVVPRAAGRVQFATAAVTLAATIGVIVIGFLVGSTIELIASAGGDESVGRGIGLILLLIFSLLQTIAALGWWLMDVGVIGRAAGGAGASRSGAAAPVSAAPAAPTGPVGAPAAGPEPGHAAGPASGPANPPSGGLPIAPGGWPGPGSAGSGPVAPGSGGPGPAGPAGPGSAETARPGLFEDESGESPTGGPASSHDRSPEPPQPGPYEFGAPPGKRPGYPPQPDTGGQPSAPETGPRGTDARPPFGSPRHGDDDNPEETQQLRF